MDPEVLRYIGMTLGPGGAVFFGLKYGVNGFKKEMREGLQSVEDYTRETRDEVRGLRQDMSRVRERVARIEGEEE